ncbi:peroxide stress protein YaaA [Paraclostridium bifermentans]|uniref:YaaA family protein n=1 Tax=Paraclostridium bifermentans TaxID=1490 RepID=UPI001C119E8D|nr:YaaA family protein [Paraclostridium bifermentans]MBS5953135.1 YaaA family protein [Paraclostridium bifermentans]MBU5287352.1 YaaA family protein [Paraclostridium bifermentans]
MITIISPATTMNFDINTNFKSSTPFFEFEVKYLISILKKLTRDEISDLMNLSNDLTNLNFDRYQILGTESSKYLQALLAFDGQVFNCIKVNEFDESDFEFANAHLRILSGLYGVLKPLDMIQSYRLEMKAKLKNEQGNDLYKFWKEKITDYIYNELNNQENKTLLNLSSNEYSKAINFKKLSKDFQVVNVEFKDFKESSNTYKVIGIYSKKARGHLTSYIIKNKIDSIEGIKNFNYDGYTFNANLSDSNSIIFTR